MNHELVSLIESIKMEKEDESISIQTITCKNVFCDVKLFKANGRYTVCNYMINAAYNKLKVLIYH